MSASDATLIAYALGEHARELRLQARSRKHSGPSWAAHRLLWRERAARAELLATQAASMAEVFEEPPARTFDLIDADGKRVGTVGG